MEELNSELSFPRVTGFGLLFGFYPHIKHMENGPHQEKLMLWNLEVMLQDTPLVDTILLAQLYIGDPHGIQTDSIRLMQITKLLKVIFMMISILMVSTGMIKSFTPT
jgi:hypothetical protein